MTEHAFDDCPAKPRLVALEEWQERQNGSLDRIEKTLNRLFMWLVGGLLTLILALVGMIATLLGVN